MDYSTSHTLPEKFASKMPRPSHRQAVYQRTRFERDEQGKRLISLSQLNTRSGRDLASLCKPSPIEPALGAPPNLSRPRPSLHRRTSSRSEHDNPRPYYKADQIPASREVPTLKRIYCARTPSDLDSLPSQRVRREPSLVSISAVDGDYQAVVNPDPRPAVPLNRTLTIRRPSQVRIPRKPVAQSTVDNVQQATDEHALNGSGAANAADTARRFSFESKPEQLSLAPENVHGRRHEERSYVQPVGLSPPREQGYAGYVRQPAQTFDEILWRMTYVASVA